MPSSFAGTQIETIVFQLRCVSTPSATCGDGVESNKGDEMKSIEEIKDLVKKLLALSESDNEFEAQVAMAKAQALLLKYKLTIADVGGNDDIEVKHKDMDWYFTEYKNAYRMHLVNCLAPLYCCEFYTSTYEGSIKRYVHIIGHPADVEVLQAVLMFADACINEWFKAFKKKNKRWTNSRLNGWKNQYGRGFAYGIERQLSEQLHQFEQETGLVVTVPAEAKDYIIQHTKQISLNPNLSRSSKAFDDGYADGKNAEMNTKLTAPA